MSPDPIIHFFNSSLKAYRKRFKECPSHLTFSFSLRAPSSNGAFTPALKSYCFKLTCLANASLPSIITVQSGEEALLKVITVLDQLLQLEHSGKLDPRVKVAAKE